MPTDPSLGTISMSIQVPELALVAQQVGLSLDVNTLSSLVNSPRSKGAIGHGGVST